VVIQRDQHKNLQHSVTALTEYTKCIEKKILQQFGQLWQWKRGSQAFASVHCFGHLKSNVPQY
jgi:hypothetical protein